MGLYLLLAKYLTLQAHTLSITELAMQTSEKQGYLLAVLKRP